MNTYYCTRSLLGHYLEVPAGSLSLGLGSECSPKSCGGYPVAYGPPVWSRISVCHISHRNLCAPSVLVPARVPIGIVLASDAVPHCCSALVLVSVRVLRGIVLTPDAAPRCCSALEVASKSRLKWEQHRLDS